MAETVNVADATRRFSELVERAARSQERFLIEQRGKPIGAIVSADDLARLEQGKVPPLQPGLLGAAGILGDIEDFPDVMADVIGSRAAAQDRPYSLE
jgi:prevent-host-death family protein